MSEPKAATVANGGTVDELNHLLRGELAAVESYEQALPKFESYPAAVAELKRVRDEHRDAIQILRDHITQLGGTPAESSGPWGDFVTTLTGAAKLIGPDTVLATLKRGEEHGIGDYTDAIGKETLSDECKDLIRVRLLPQCQGHLANLDSIRAFIG